MQRLASVLSKTGIAFAHARRVVTLGNAQTFQCSRAVSTSRVLYSADDIDSTSNNSSNKTAEELVPDNFFDHEEEATQEILDVIAAMAGSEKFDESSTNLISTGLESLTTNHNNINMNDILELKNRIESGEEGNVMSEQFDGAACDPTNDEFVDFTVPVEKINNRFMNSFLNTAATDLGDHLVPPGSNPYERLMQEQFLSTEDLNFTMPRNFVNNDGETREDNTSTFLENFTSKTSEEYPHGSNGDPGLPGFRHCSGKKQRRGQKGLLECHLIDLDNISPFNVNDLRRFLTADSEILPKTQTGLCAKCQRKVAKTIKHSRNLGLIAHIDEYVIRDQNPMNNSREFHKGASHISKTVL
jgi:ribosomal protein S18